MTTLHVGPPIEGVAGYCLAKELPDRAIRRRWLFHGVPRSVEWRDGGIVKTVEPFTEHQTTDAMLTLLDECEGRQVVRPSSYGDLFHQRIYQPSTRAAHRKLFPPGVVPGGWNAVPLEKRVRGKLWKYDIRSAYLWALSQGLPHPRTFYIVKRVNGPGLYWVPSPVHPMLPHPWDKPGHYPATEDELRRLPIDHREVTYGVAFTPDSLDVTPWVTDIREWSCWRAVGRAYWGRWIAGGSAVAETFTPAGDLNTSRDLPDVKRNPIWAAIITSRLRLRLWDLWDAGDRRVFRVVTDSVVTNEELPVGPNIGDWKLEDYYPHGAVISLQAVQPLPRAA